jgi:hypothetical protein
VTPPETATKAAPPKGTYKDTYRDAINAKNEKRWDEAARLFQTAITQNGKDSGERINISGFGNIEPYFPHYYLGLALKNTGNCPAALREFDLSEQDGAIQNTNLHKTLVQNRTACGGKQ